MLCLLYLLCEIVLYLYCVVGSTLVQAMPFGATQFLEKLDKYNNGLTHHLSMTSSGTNCTTLLEAF